jgi:hypothetical protein
LGFGIPCRLARRQAITQVVSCRLIHLISAMNRIYLTFLLTQIKNRFIVGPTKDSMSFDEEAACVSILF